VIPLRVTVF